MKRFWMSVTFLFTSLLLHTDGGLLLNATMSNAVDSVVCFKVGLKRRCRVLFIGDSITDGGWGRSGGSMAPSGKRNHDDLNHLLGHGYVEMCAAHFQSVYPERDYEFLNRGISGNTLCDLQLRWREDAISLCPDVVSILVGTNDAEAFLRDATRTTFDYQRWEQDYRRLLDSLRTYCPKVQIVLGTPFVAKVGKIGQAANYSERQVIVQRLAAITKKVADDYHATLVSYDELFASLQTPDLRPDYWIWDGVHPTTAGHRRMADLWIKAVEGKILF